MMRQYSIGQCIKLAVGTSFIFLLPALCNLVYAATATCTLADVAVFPERINVKCNESFDNISYFAVPTSNAQFSNSIKDMATTALSTGKKVVISYEPEDLSGAAYGCGTANCRPIQNLRILP